MPHEMTSDTKGSVRVARLFNATPDRVFDAWVSPGLVAKWMVGPAAGEMGLIAVDPRVGGRYSFVVKRQGEDVEHTGEYVEFDRPHRLAFTWGVPRYTKELTTLQLEFIPASPGTTLKLIHDGVRSEFAERTASGWNAICDVIDAALMADG
jgi:uncharacterized protein YndB with AHSA1/START domain